MMRSNPTRRSTVFISYSHADKKWLKRLQVHLKPLIRDSQIDVWDDTKIQPGSDWRAEIRKAIDSAKVAILLVSADFLGSDFIATEELPPLLKAAQDEGATILPVILSPSFFDRVESLKRFQSVNAPSNPLINMTKGGQEAVWKRVAEAVESALAAEINPPESIEKAKDYRAQVEHAARFVLSRTELRPRIGLMLGSAFGSLADKMTSMASIDYQAIPYYPRAATATPTGRLLIGNLASVPVAALYGRMHLYEGYPFEQLAFPIRMLALMGVRAIILSNAAGGLNPGYLPGSLVLFQDHINLPENMLAGVADERFGPRFIDMTEAYSRHYRDLARKAAHTLGFDLAEGVYAMRVGPTYETPAESRHLRALGADLVGMSLVPEVMAARHMGLPVLAIACVTSVAVGMGTSELDHAEVLDTGKRMISQLTALIEALLPQIAAEFN